MFGSKKNVLFLSVVAVGLLAACSANPSSPDVGWMPPEGSIGTSLSAGSALSSGESLNNRGNGALGVVYVTSQGLYYDTFVTAQVLPPHGPFQLLVNGETEFGPGDKDYVGGRWKVPNQEGGYDYFLCPLLGPGRTEP